MTGADWWDEETEPVMGTFSPMLPWDNSSLIFSQLECCSTAMAGPGWSQQTEKTKTEHTTRQYFILTGWGSIGFHFCHGFLICFVPETRTIVVVAIVFVFLSHCQPNPGVPLLLLFVSNNHRVSISVKSPSPFGRFKFGPFVGLFIYFIRSANIPPPL